MYGLELWGCASASNTAINQRYQAKMLRIITNAPRFVTNLTLHTDLRIPQVRSVFKQRIEIHRTALESHPNLVIEPILVQHNRRLKRRWTFDKLTSEGAAGRLLAYRLLRNSTLAHRNQYECMYVF